MSPLELWGGFECTIARVGDQFRDQCLETGHHGRLSDLDFAASLGLSRLRYPVIWETVAPDDPSSLNWSRPDPPLARLHDLRLPVIAGLVHHGSGPRYTNLLDPDFPQLLADYARAVAERYPWISDFTPVNEPLTTARFSGLYGHWYPHGRDEETFLRALVTQCKGICRAMAAIRQVTPAARLVQTEDLGRVFATPLLAYQAAYENERRWLSLDLLTGRIDRHHTWHRRMISAGVEERDLDMLVGEPCPPDIVGINHYLTSDRYLDEDLEAYPRCHHGGNGRHGYADVAAVRGPVAERDLGFEPRLIEAWERYRLPLAMTEVHNGATREEQLRWLLEAWTAAGRLRGSGVDLRAFTVWALAGGVDWPSVLTRRDGIYETGVLDGRANPPRPTALAKAVRSLAVTGDYGHDVIHGPGWWHRPQRLHRQDVSAPAIRAAPHGAPLLITGASGTLGQAIRRICDERGLTTRSLARADLDIADAASVRDVVGQIKPWAIVNAAGYVRVADAYQNKPRCLRENSLGPRVLAEVAAERRIQLVTFSSDLVFSGVSDAGYAESDATSPRCVYGESKVLAEYGVFEANPEALIVRTSTFFGAWDTFNLAYFAMQALRQGHSYEADSSIVSSPTYLPDLIHEVLNLLIDDASGIWHVVNAGAMSRSTFAMAVARAAQLDISRIRSVSGALRNTSLVSEKGIVLPPVEEAIERYVAALSAQASSG